MTDHPLVVIGGGLAGLACAVRLHAAGVPVTLLEATDRVGGRVRTDAVDGFLLDRGFQVYLPAYPEGRALLDHATLDLRPFYNGARIRVGRRFRRVADPVHHPLAAAASVLTGTVPLRDAARLARLRRALATATPDDAWSAPERSTARELEARGLSPAIVDRFFRPFFGGVFLDRELRTSARMFRFTFRMFAEGAAALPAGGMERIPFQLASRLPPGTVRCGQRVAGLADGAVRLHEGGTVPARGIVVATDADEATRLLTPTGAPIEVPGWQSTTTLYFAAPRSPVGTPVLVLDGTGRGPVNHLCVPSDVAPGYAPAGQALISANVVGPADPTDAGLEGAVRTQLRDWFGADVDGWRLLRIYRISRALPRFFGDNGGLEPPTRRVAIRRGLYVCGDHRDNASINGALASGRRAAEAVLNDHL